MPLVLDTPVVVPATEEVVKDRLRILRFEFAEYPTNPAQNEVTIRYAKGRLVDGVFVHLPEDVRSAHFQGAVVNAAIGGLPAGAYAGIKAALYDLLPDAGTVE